MCGIYGCVGKNAYNKVLNGLKMLQYRGYDSCGIAYYNKTFNIEKAIGALKNLKADISASIAFGHTRWATNGIVNLNNAHPHVSYDGKFVVVHNGIIKNADKIKESLSKNGVSFYSSTDTEVIVNLIALKNTSLPLNQVLESLFNELDGSFSLIIGDKEGNLYLVKRFSPLNVLISDDGIYASSDISSLKNGDIYSLQDGDILKISNNMVTRLNGEPIITHKHDNNLFMQGLDKYVHFMQKEIFETPSSIKNTYNLIKDNINFDIINNYEKLTLIGCGTAYHSCLIGEYLLKNELDKQVNSFLASNYQISKRIDPSHLHIIVSQSGETADCIKVADEIKRNNGKLLLITNESKSTLSKMADYHIFTKAEKEIAVASTKTYCCQLFVFAYMCNKIKHKNYSFNIDNFVSNLDSYISKIDIKDIAYQLKDTDKMIMISKDIDYITMLEASLKIREIDYVYTIPMYAGELKHGTLSLIENSSIVLALNTEPETNKLQNAINEIESRNGMVIDFSKFVPNDVEHFYKPIYAIIPYQLLSYEIAVLNGRNPDMPRNLAKSVTVE